MPMLWMIGYGLCGAVFYAWMLRSAETVLVSNAPASTVLPLRVVEGHRMEADTESFRRAA